MNYFILWWSHRPDSQSTKVAEWIDAALGQLFSNDSTYLYNLKNNPLPLRNDWIWDKENQKREEFMVWWNPVREELQKADALVVVCPEWAWMATPGVKNFFLYCRPQDVGNKPVLLVTVSSGSGWRYPVAELRQSSYKNTHMVYIPQHVIVDHVEEKLNNHELTGENEADTYIKKRLQYSLRMLREYGKALQSVRASGVEDFDTYPYGM